MLNEKQNRLLDEKWSCRIDEKQRAPLGEEKLPKLYSKFAQNSLENKWKKIIVQVQINIMFNYRY